MSARSTSLLAGIVILSVTVLAGCRQDNSSPASPVPAAAASTAGFTMIESRTGEPPTEGIRTEGVIDFDTGDIHFKRFLRDGRQLGEQMDIGNVTYARLGQGRWSRQEDLLDPLGKAQSAAVEALADPSRSVQFLREVSGDVREMGRDVVAGTPTARYSAIIDLEKSPDADGAEFTDATWPDGARFPVEVWVDDADRVRRLRFDHYPGLVQTWEFHDWGLEVNLSPPPDNEIQD